MVIIEKYSKINKGKSAPLMELKRKIKLNIRKKKKSAPLMCGAGSRECAFPRRVRTTEEKTPHLCDLY